MDWLKEPMSIDGMHGEDNTANCCQEEPRTIPRSPAPAPAPAPERAQQPARSFPDRVQLNSVEQQPAASKPNPSRQIIYWSINDASTVKWGKMKTRKL